VADSNEHTTKAQKASNRQLRHVYRVVSHKSTLNGPINRLQLAIRRLTDPVSAIILFFILGQIILLILFNKLKM
jgi:hypothetical protein